MKDGGGLFRVSNLLLAAGALVMAGSLWYRYERVRRRASRLAQDAAEARAEADAAGVCVFESKPETRFEDPDLRHRDAAKFD